MTNSDLQRLSAEVRAEWRNWTKIVRLYASRRKTRFRVIGDQYKALHRRLLHVVKLLSQQAPEPQRAHYRQLERILAPWVTAESLNSADRSVLAKLLECCDDAQQQLDLRLVILVRRLRRALVVAIAVVLLAALVAVQFEESQLTDLALAIDGWGRQICRSIAEDSTQWKLILLGGAAAVFGAIVVWCAGRGY